MILGNPSQWSEWSSLADPAATRTLPSTPGLYCVRVIGEEALAYVGQTSTLSTRVGSLRTLYRGSIPLNDPHTATPCLWVMRLEQGAEFEFSVCEASHDVTLRKALECVVVSEHRELHGTSPTANFGRMPEGWVKSSGNNATVRARGGPFPGYRDPNVHRSLDYPCVIDRDRPPTAAHWGGLPWCEWTSPNLAPSVNGVYRVRNQDDSLTYIGQGRIRDRLRAHLAKANDPTHRQYAGFSRATEASWVELPDASPQQLLEIECDLIASHVLWHGAPPLVQFLG